MRQELLNRLGWLATGTAVIMSLLLAGCSSPMNMAVTAPVFTPAGGSFAASQTVTVGDITPGAVLHCTTDGSAPSASSPLCPEPVTVYKSETLNAIAVMPNGTLSSVSTAAFVIALPAAETPVISPASGTFTSIKTVTISDATAGATIYYTTDGSVPTASATVYGGSITVGSTETISAIAVSSATTASAVATATFTINLPAATPMISPSGGTFTSIQSVSISDASAGAAIYYTTDGTAPTINSTLYSGAISVAKSETILAIATAPESSVSAAARAAFTINLPFAAAPVISPNGGTFTTPQTVTLSDSTAGVSVYYTIDGTIPSASSALYTAPFTVAKNEVVKAVAVATGYTNSVVASAAFTVNLTVAVPVIAPAGGTFASVQSVTISDATPTTAIYYTLDGSTPTASSTRYSAPISVGQSETVQAIGAATGFLNSPVASAAFAINLPAAAPPVISPAGGTFTTSRAVTITDSVSGAAIYYTVDGSTPTTASTRYTAAFAVDATGTVKAIATANGYSASAVTSATFTFNQAAAATPVISPAGGAYTSSQMVTITDTTPASMIHYTVDGSNPIVSSPIYSGPITVAATETVKAIATATGFDTSAVATAAYTINLPPAATPTFSPAGGTYSGAQSVSLSDTTTGTTIYYTFDGSTPTVSSTRYTAAINVASTETVKAIAVASGFSDSAVASATYTINMVTGTPLSGTVKSGTTAIAGSQVQLYAAGTTGYGSAPTALLATAVTTGATGAFTLGFTCPAAPADQVYLVATSGNSGHGANSGIALMLALGKCSSIKSGASVTINEVTTVASAYALSQFASLAAGGGINVGAPAPSATCVSTGASTCNYAGLASAFKTVSNLVNSGTGAALTMTPFYQTGTAAFLNSSTVPQARINLLADVLATCVDAASAAPCPALYSAAKPSGGTEPADTLQAALSIAQNPGQNVATLYALVGSSAPYAPHLGAAPNDFALALTFTGGGLGLPPGTTSTDILDTGLAIDAVGNIWVIGYDPNPPPTAVNQNGTLLAEFDSTGAALTPASTVTKTNGKVLVTYGGAAPYDGNVPPTSSSGLPVMFEPTSIAIDQSGNAWINGVDTTEISPALTLLLGNVGLDYGLPGAGTTITLSGDVLVVKSTGKVQEFGSDGTQISSGSGWTGVSPVDTAGYKKVKSLLFDSAGTTLWSSDQDGAGDLYQIDPVSGEITFDYKPATNRNTPLVADDSGNIYGCATGSGTLDVFNASSTSILHTYTVQGGRGCGGGPMVIDGDGHIFAYNSNSKGEFFDEFTTAGVLLSPSGAGFTATSSHEALVLNVPVASAIDGSGSLWVINNSTGASGSSGNVLVQFIGIAAPVVTPTSVALQNSELATRP